MIRKVLLLGAVGLLVLGASAAYAFPPIDLTVSGATVNGSDGTIWTQLVSQPTGTGVYNPFLRLQATGTEAGMNTDGDAHATYDDVAGIWTHGITLGQLNTITQGGQTYYSFSCDINEPNGGGQNLLSLDELRIYTLAGSSALTSEGAVTGAGGVLKYNLDGGGNNQTVYLDYNLAAGSGHDDFQVLIPTSFFAGASSTDQVYFYSAFGETTGMAADFSSADGFEEWHALLGQAPPPPSLPEPSTVMILGTGLLGLAATRIRKK
jgi:PEP-CTERM motif-containing protein